MKDSFVLPSISSLLACWSVSSCWQLMQFRRATLSIVGSVTHKGKPVVEGYIVMEPDTAKGAKGGPAVQDSRW